MNCLKEQLKKSNINFPESMLNNNLLEAILNNKASGVLSSKYFRGKFYRKYFDFISPIKVNLNHQSFFYYVPILETIKTLFKNPFFYENYFQEKRQHLNKFEDICDGEVFRKNFFFFQIIKMQFK